uniref:Uncharacterized protein n=1 Tax=Corethrella appendiculata TaxID=1370023 RepID=U5ENS5_9DIPT
MRVEINLNVQEYGSLEKDLDEKIAEFKQDSDKMSEVSLFVDEVLSEAKKNAEQKLQTKLDEEKPKNGNGNNLFSAIKRGRVVTRTRGFVLRIFEAICNCTNQTVQIPGRNPNTSSQQQQPQQQPQQQ